MKKRIVALILTVVMSLLTLASCGSFDFVEEDLTAYASFDAAKFMEDLKKLEIEDGEFTTDEATREKILAATVYNAIVDKLLAQRDEDDRKTEGKLGAGDVLYFVYYATDADGNMFFGSDMNESSITASSTKGNHVVRLDDYLEGEDDEFLKLVADAVNKADLDIKDYVYSMLSKTELETEAADALKETKPDATDDEIKNAKAEAIKVKVGKKYYISYTVTHEETNEEGVTTKVTEKVAYELVTLTTDNEFTKQILDAVTANVGGTVAPKAPITVKKTVDDKEVTYDYSEVKILWEVDGEVNPMVTFEYTPYDTKKEVTPDSLYASGKKIDLKDKALTYHICPVYFLEAPAFEAITGADVLYYINGSSLSDTSYEAFEDVEGLEDLLKDVKSVFATTEKDNKFYAEGTELAKLLKAYNDVGGTNPTTEQKADNTKAKEALTEGQNAELKKVVEKIAALTVDGKTLATLVLDEYKDNTKHSLKESYDSDIVSKVRQEVLDLIYESVKLNGQYPEKLLKEYVDHLYESYEYTYYTGDFDKTTSNVKKYATLNDYLVATLKVSGVDKIGEAIEKEAKEAIDPIIKIYVVAKAIEKYAVADMPGYIQADIDAGVYEINEEEYRDYYGDKADKKIAEAKENAEENKKAALEEATMFLIDDAYMRRYKREVGSAFYRQQIDAYGEINLRAALQFNKIFYYLTCTEIDMNDDEGHVEIQYTKDDNVRLDFRTVDYTIKVETEEDEADKAE
ncbi:MAG: hypothetical protein IJX58_04320 [Clostridia bacterium]|nr:hypothetical protein [Clostridia bacterium]